MRQSPDGRWRADRPDHEGYDLGPPNIMTAIPAPLRGEHESLTRRLLASAIHIEESADGVILQLSAVDYDMAAQFVARERLCCPFLRFSLEVSPGVGPVSLRLEGPPGTGEFLRAELHRALSRPLPLLQDPPAR